MSVEYRCGSGYGDRLVVEVVYGSADRRILFQVYL